MNTTENNKLIAEFMGFEMTHKINYVPSKYPNFMKNAEHLKVDNADNIPFHSSWDWLMPVVEKIESLGFEVLIGRISCQINEILNRENAISSFVCGDISKKIEIVYSACVEFIKWYNEQQK